MKPKLILTLLYSFLSILVYAQKDIEISITRNSDLSVDLNYSKNKPGIYTIKLKLNALTNTTTSEEYETTVYNSSGTLLKLKPINTAQPVSFNTYSYQYILGSTTSKVDTNFIYALPLPPETEYSMRSSSLITSSILREQTPEYFKSFTFRTQHASDILAIRKGTVVNIIDQYDVTPDTKFSYKSSTNKITVQHEDGSMAVYNCFEKGSAKVKEGDIVYPQTKLASAVKYSDSDKAYTFFVRIIYLKRKPFDIPVPKTLKESVDNPRYDYVNIKFFYGDNTPPQDSKKPVKVPELPKSILQKELSKKELKKLAFN